MNDIIPGDVLVEKINLITSDGSKTITIKPQVKFISIYESIMSPVLYGELLIVDAIDLLRGFPIIGEEKVEIEFSTPTLAPITLNLRVFHVSNISIDSDQKLKSYTLHLTSEEAFKNASLLINRKFTKENHANIKDILVSDLATEKKLEASTTKGIDTQLITNITPLQAIDRMRLRSVSPKYLSSSFVFFEDRWGFKFITLEEMIEKNKGKSAQKHFVYDASNLITDIRKINARHMIGWKAIKHTNTIDKIQSGSLNTKVLVPDMVTGDVTEYVSGNQEFETTGPDAAAGTAKFNQAYGQTTSRTFMVPFNSADEKVFIAEKIGPLQSFVDKITQNIAHVHIYGDSDIFVGDLLSASVSTGSGLTEGDSSKAIEANYLVAKVRHMIILGDRPIYTQSLELVNNSYDY